MPKPKVRYANEHGCGTWIIEMTGFATLVAWDQSLEGAIREAIQIAEKGYRW